MERNSNERGGRGREDNSRDSGRAERSGSREESRVQRNVRSGRDDPPARGRDSERGGREDSRSSSRGDASGSSRGFVYTPRDKATVEKRATMGSREFTKILKDGVKMFTPAKGPNLIRILPATWPDAKHYGLDIFVHYGVGPDRDSYLDLSEHDRGPDPISEELAAVKATGRASDEELRELRSTRRVLVYLIDRDNEAEGVQAWAMPWGIDKDISVLSTDKSTGELLNIDDPRDGYDIEFRKDGEGIKTKYSGIAIARRSSPLGKDSWLDVAVDNPLPDQLQFYTYDEIAKAFGGGGATRDRDDRQQEDRPRDDERSRDRLPSRDEAPRREASSSSRDEPGLTWKTVHDMTSAELDALCESEPGLEKINPHEAENDAQLADWICEDLKLAEEAAPARRGAPPADAGSADKLRDMREARGRR